MNGPGSQQSAEQVAARSASAARDLAHLPGTRKNQWLEALAEALAGRTDELLAAAAKDDARVAASSPREGRHVLPTDWLERVIGSVQTLVGLGDPVGKAETTWLRPNGLKIERVRIPIGALALVYPGCPATAIRGAAVSLKSGNALILCSHGCAPATGRLLQDVFADVFAATDLPVHAIQTYCWQGIAELQTLLRLKTSIDLAILHTTDQVTEEVAEAATVPVIRCTPGSTCIYVDEEADLEMALSIIADTVVPMPCVAAEEVVCFVHRRVQRQLGEALAGRLAEEDDQTAGGTLPVVTVVVDSMEGAIERMAAFPPGRGNVIVSTDRALFGRFTSLVDAPCVYVNASPRFTDSGQFGMGAGIGMSTGRIHARGPMGIEEMTTYKYVVSGTGQVLR